MVDICIIVLYNDIVDERKRQNKKGGVLWNT